MPMRSPPFLAVGSGRGAGRRMQMTGQRFPRGSDCYEEMPMKTDLFYYTGTGNSLWVARNWQRNSAMHGSTR